MATKPTIDGRRYIQLTNNILLEYIYICDRYEKGSDNRIEDDLIGIDADGDFVGTYASSNIVGSCLMKNKYTNELYFCNTDDMKELAGNPLSDTILPVDTVSTKWVQCKKYKGEYYTSRDNYWTDNKLKNGDSDVKITGYPNTEYIVYDIVRVWFQSGYVSGYDGWVLNAFTRDSKNRYVNLACKLFMNTDTLKVASEPLWFNDRLYNNYIEWRQPSVAQLSHDGNTDSIVKNGWGTAHLPYNRRMPHEDTLPYLLTRGEGFGSNPYIGFELFGVGGTYTTDTYGFDCRVTSMLTSSMIPNRALNDNIVARIWENSEEGDYIKLYGYYIQDNNQKYDPYSLYEWLRDYGSGQFSFVHQITVIENYVDTETNETMTYTHTPVSFIQTWEELTELDDNDKDGDPTIHYRPILKYTANMLNEGYGAKINYVLRIMNHRDNTSIIKTASYNIIDPKRYGLHLQGLDMEGVNTVHVYNRIEMVDGVQVSGATNPVGNNANDSVRVNKYVTTSFIDRRNIKVSISPVNIAEVANPTLATPTGTGISSSTSRVSR